MQLHMALPAEARENARTAATPAGYLLRTYRAADREGWIALMRAAGFESWGQDALRASLAQALPDGVFFIEQPATREIVATAMAGHSPSDLHPFGGELGWVATSPAHRGKRLSSIVCSAVTLRLASAGYREIYLMTDDWRLPAIKTYLNLGFVPLLCSADMEERWRIICRNLDLRYEQTGARWP